MIWRRRTFTSDDVAGIERCFSDPEYLARIHPDEDAFLDLHGCDFIVSEKYEVLN